MKKVFGKTLVEVVNEDCMLWMKLNNRGQSVESYMYLNECEDSKESGLYQLILDGVELWYGTLEQINAVVKSMINKYCIDNNKSIFDLE